MFAWIIMQIVIKDKYVADLFDQTNVSLLYYIIVSLLWMNHKDICPICKKRLFEHSKLQDRICKMITIKQFANNSPGFDVQFRPFFEKEGD